MVAKGVRIRSDVFHHCLVPIQAVLPSLDTFDDFQTLCSHVAACDQASNDGYTSIAKAALALGLMDAHLSALLDLTSDFSTPQSHQYFLPQEQKVHLVGICTALFIQFLGKQVLQISPFDHFPSLRAIGKLEAASEQVELSKATPSRSRSRHSSSAAAGPTKAHKQHLAHVLKQLTAVEKTLSEQLARHTVPFLQMLNRLLRQPAADTSYLACLSLLFEHQNSAELDVLAWCPISAAGSVDVEDLSKRLAEQLQISSAAAQWIAAGAGGLLGSARMRSVLEDDCLSDGGSSVSGNETGSEAESSVSTSFNAVERAAEREWDPQDIVGTSRTTVLRGESDLTSHKINVIGCHEASVYILAPLKHVFISCCTDCIVVVGACGGSFRVENCERMHIVAAALRLTIATCHDCTFNVAVNTQPLLAGDNRFIQLAPFNAQYEHLTRHLREAGVARAPNHWNSPLELARDPYQLKSPRSSPERAPSEPGIKCPVMLMPPEDFLPFMVPFKGGAGPLCGGASQETFQWSPDSYATDKQPASRARPDVFPFPPEYAKALQNKIVRVATMRSAVKTSFMDQSCKQEVQAVIQAYFKDWLMNSNNIRQVYDLARLEREHAKAVSSSKARSASEPRAEIAKD